MGDTIRPEYVYRQNEQQVVRVADTGYICKNYSIADGDTQEVDVFTLLGNKYGNSVSIKVDKDAELYINSLSNDMIFVPNADDFSLDNYNIIKLYIKNPVGYGVGALACKVFVTG